MSWIKINEELYSNSISPHILFLQDGTWLVKKTNYDTDLELPIEDVLNNPIGTQEILFADGSETNPSIAFQNAPSTGIFRDINGNLQITKNGIPTGLDSPYLCIVDEKPSGTAGGTFTSGAWRVRTLNTIRTNTIQGANLASDTITLPQGKYKIIASCPATVVGYHKAKLENISDTIDAIIGTSEYSINTSNVPTRSFLSGEFEIASSKDFQIQHRCSSTQTTTGFGLSSGFGVVEVYTQVEIWKIG
jgi:hypothetical protein